MSRAPYYLIHSKVFPDGREEHRVEIGRFLWFRRWLRTWVTGMVWDSGRYEIEVFRKIEDAYMAIDVHWELYLASLPAMRVEQRFHDPAGRH